MFRSLSYALTLVLALTLPAVAQDSNSNDKNLDIRSSAGDLHVGKDADARKTGLPLYPGARLKTGDENSDRANLAVFTEAFGLKLVVASYESDDAPAKVIDFYRDKLKKYGKVLECRSHKRGGHIDAHHDDDDKDSKSKELKCEEDCDRTESRNRRQPARSRDRAGEQGIDVRARLCPHPRQARRHLVP